MSRADSADHPNRPNIVVWQKIHPAADVPPNASTATTGCQHTRPCCRSRGLTVWVFLISWLGEWLGESWGAGKESTDELEG